MSRSTPRRKYPPPAAAGQQPKPRASQPAAAVAPKWHLDLTISVVLLLGVIGVYSQVGHFFFVTYDDPLYVTENAHVRAGLTLDSIKWAMTAVDDSNWVPLTLLSHMAVCDLFGMQSGMHHWVNVVLHGLASVLLFAGLRRATGSLWPSAFVAAVFALHPLHVESVAWVTERKDVLSTFFWFLALYAYVLYSERPGPRRYWMVMALFCLGLMAKPMLVTFPFTLLLLDIWPLRRAQFPRTLWEKVPFFAVSAAFSVLIYLVQRPGEVVQAMSRGESVRNALVSYVSYIGQMFWPAGLTLFYPYRTSLTPWQAAGALAILLAISVLAVLTRRTRPYIATGWFWYLGTLVPVIGLIQFGIRSHADRYMYVPMVGLSMILAWGAADLVRRWPQAKLAIASLGVVSLLACFFAASAQAEYWRNSEALFQRAISLSKDNYLAQYNLADYLMEVPGRADEAVPHFEEALRLRPDSAFAHNGLGGYLMQTGHDAEAAAQFEAALRLNPDLAAAHFNLGVIYSKTPARVPEAIAHYETALHAFPQYARAHKNLGMLLLSLGRTPEAISHLEAAQSIQPDPEITQILNSLRPGQR